MAGGCEKFEQQNIFWRKREFWAVTVSGYFFGKNYRVFTMFAGDFVEPAISLLKNNKANRLKSRALI